MLSALRAAVDMTRDRAELSEVERVFGKVGRAETATDPAPLNMVWTRKLRQRPR